MESECVISALSSKVLDLLFLRVYYRKSLEFICQTNNRNKLIIIMIQIKKVLFLSLMLSVGFTSGAQDKSFHTAKALAPEAGSMFIFPERIQLQDGGFLNCERATMFVPLNRSKVECDVISLDVYRFKASDRANPDTPPIFFLHGGPSFEGLEARFKKIGTFEKNYQYLLDIADVVVVSQRGIGPSKPTTIIERPVENLPPDMAYNEEVAVRSLREILTRERRVWEELGLDLKGFTVLEAAEDLNDVRKAFGYDKISLIGGSFGTHWGMSLMRMHPEIIARVVFTGCEGPDHTYDDPGYAWNVYKRVAEEAENSDELKGLTPPGGLIAAVETIIKRIEAKPFTVDVVDPETRKVQKVLFDEHVAKQLSIGYSDDLASWPADIINLYNGNFEDAAKKIVTDYNNGVSRPVTASYFMLDCGSGITPLRLEKQLADPANNIIGRMNWDYINGCQCWDSDLGNDFRQNFETNIPMVIIHGTWDRNTPLENAVELVPYFANAKFVPLKRGPHNSLGAAIEASDEFKNGLLKFLESGDASEINEEMELPPVKWVVPDQQGSKNQSASHPDKVSASLEK
jgi:pimeloyl-ACP methyl ester carboxylesterase